MDLGEQEKILSRVEELQRRPKYLQWLFIMTNGRLLLLNAAGIIWLEAQGNYVRVHHECGLHLLRETISVLEKQLNPSKFLRIRRSTIVQIDRIRELHRRLHGNYRVTLRNGTQLILSRNYRSRFQKAVGTAL